jgi:hypothetical protein
MAVCISHRTENPSRGLPGIASPSCRWDCDLHDPPATEVNVDALSPLSLAEFSACLLADPVVP